MAIRSLVNKLEDFEFYSSTFDTTTGVLVRKVTVPERLKTKRYEWAPEPTLVGEWAKSKGISTRDDYPSKGPYYDLQLKWAEKFGQVIIHEEGEPSRPWTADWRTKVAFSPVPETIDVKITDWCNFGCTFCYMDSTTKGKHAPKSLLNEIFLGLDEAPYQIAYGGGEPTAHPDFPWFLEVTRKSGSVPNYTTAGHILRDEVFDATNKYCGGVALTYHAFKGPEYFKKTYETWRRRLDPRVQLNIHVIFDKDVADNLLDLKEMGLSNLHVVLLAYYPVGRANWEGIAPKGVYDVTLPAALKTVTEAGFKIAFSEGLLPYFLSHQFPEVNTTFACQQEGLFSCYVDDKGRVSHSSFSPATDEDKMSIYTTRFQEIWNQLSNWSDRFDPCDTCAYKASCHIPHESHYLLCKFAEHNQRMPTKIPVRRTRLPVMG